MKLNIIDDYIQEVAEEAQQADLIILACPVERAEQNYRDFGWIDSKG